MVDMRKKKLKGTCFVCKRGHEEYGVRIVKVNPKWALCADCKDDYKRMNENSRSLDEQFRSAAAR